MTSGAVDIVLVQGDTCEKNIYIKGEQASAVDSVYVTCKALNISQLTTYDPINKCYVFKLEPEDTAKLSVTRTTYDITIKFTSNDILTASYRATFTVLPKINSIEGDTNEQL